MIHWDTLEFLQWDFFLFLLNFILFYLGGRWQGQRAIVKGWGDEWD